MLTEPSSEVEINVPRDRAARVGVQPTCARFATAVNADGDREIRGLQVTSVEDGAGWLAFFRNLTGRGLTGATLVTSDAHRRLLESIGATLPGAACNGAGRPTPREPDARDPKSVWGQHDEWTEKRRYIGLDILAHSGLTLTESPTDTEQKVTIAAITA